MKRIGIVPVSKGSGAGLVTAMLAVEAANSGNLPQNGNNRPSQNGKGSLQKGSRITAVELGRGNLYDQLCADRWFQLRPMISYWNCIHGEGQAERIANPRCGVNWLLRTPEDRDRGELERDRAVKLIYSLPGDMAFLDFSSVNSEELFYLLEDVTQVVAVVDPLPSKMLEGYERLYRLKLRTPSVHWVVNRWSDEIDGRELKKILGAERNWVALPEIPRDLMYRAEYSGCGLIESQPIRERMAPGLRTLLERLRL